MRKRFVSSILSLVMLLLLPAASALSAGGFADVRESDWYYDDVLAACELGLFRGRGEGVFGAKESLTLAEAVKLASVLHSMQQDEETEFIEGDIWYDVYAEYALENGLISSADRLRDTATRAETAELIFNAMSPDALAEINSVPDAAIWDVSGTEAYGAAVYSLYRAGILTGSDGYGTFSPDACITRAEAAATFMRAADPARRKTMPPICDLPAEQMYSLCREAVFTLEVFNESGDRIYIGSGFFISSGGVAVTNYHVIEDGITAVATTYDGVHHGVTGVYDYDTVSDLALLQVGNGGYRALALLDSDTACAGMTAYTLGSPNELDGSITRGIVSNPARMHNDVEYIQFSAPIAPGSGGGPLVNARGQVIGVVCSTFSAGQNLNLALPSNTVRLLERGELVELRDIVPPIE